MIPTHSRQGTYPTFLSFPRGIPGRARERLELLRSPRTSSPVGPARITAPSSNSIPTDRKPWPTFPAAGPVRMAVSNRTSPLPEHGSRRSGPSLRMMATRGRQFPSITCTREAPARPARSCKDQSAMIMSSRLSLSTRVPIPFTCSKSSGTAKAPFASR